ncbi:MAG: oxygen-dependent coproporphyrinogen oxidase [Acidobacteria bacterium]|nr:oxygen-dependent coproporphyrinogen oxidase [Acidobacteriota bacterium]
MLNDVIWRERAESYFKELQDRISRAIEELDGGSFREDAWSREGGGGGRTRILEEGRIFEKAGVNFSSVHGNLPQEFAAKIPLGGGTEFFATGVSLVFHPRSPMVPAVHANFRYLEKGGAAWFGGGTDLTPCYPVAVDAAHFHRTIKQACDRHDPEFYPRFKKWCDEYFTLKHRGEMRGVGGVFFDYVQGDREKNFAFVRDVGDSFLDAYLPIARRRMNEPYGERERQYQLYRRGRYVEFNLLYDRGAIFGLETRGRTESILMSLPPLVRWVYDFKPEPDSREAKALEFFQPRDWAEN